MEKIVHRYEEKFSLIYRDANIGYWTIFVMMILALLALAVFVGMYYFHIQPTIFSANTFMISNDLAFGVFQFSCHASCDCDNNLDKLCGDLWRFIALCF